MPCLLVIRWVIFLMRLNRSRADTRLVLDVFQGRGTEGCLGRFCGWVWRALVDVVI